MNDDVAAQKFQGVGLLVDGDDRFLCCSVLNGHPEQVVKSTLLASEVCASSSGDEVGGSIFLSLDVCVVIAGEDVANAEFLGKLLESL